MDKTTFEDPVGIGRDYACYAPDSTDCPWVSEDANKHTFYETNDSSYYIQNVWVNEMFFQESESATVGNVNTSYIFAFKCIPYIEHVTCGGVTVVIPDTFLSLLSQFEDALVIYEI